MSTQLNDQDIENLLLLKSNSDSQNYEVVVESNSDEFNEVAFQHTSSIILYSKGFLVFYSFIICFQVGLIIFSCIKTNYFRDNLTKLPIWYLICDFTIVCLMCLEVILRMIILRTGFFKSKVNWIELSLCILCLVCIPLSFLHHKAIVLSIILTIIRYISQIIRIVIMVRMQIHRSQQLHACDLNIDFQKYSTFTLNTGANVDLSPMLSNLSDDTDLDTSFFLNGNTEGYIVCSMGQRIADGYKSLLNQPTPFGCGESITLPTSGQCENYHNMDHISLPEQNDSHNHPLQAPITTKIIIE